MSKTHRNQHPVTWWQVAILALAMLSVIWMAMADDGSLPTEQPRSETAAIFEGEGTP